MKVTKVKFPVNYQLKSTDFDYADSYQGNYVDKSGQVSSTDIGKAFFTSAPKWTAILFKLRNLLVSIFGLKTPGKMGDRQERLDNFRCEPNEKLGLFKVYDKTENEVILGQDDKHLDFRISLLKEEGDEEAGLKKLTISTTVKFNNWFGRLYFLPVKPFHQLIVPSMLPEIIEQLKRKAGQTADEN